MKYTFRTDLLIHQTNRIDRISLYTCCKYFYTRVVKTHDENTEVNCTLLCF